MGGGAAQNIQGSSNVIIGNRSCDDTGAGGSVNVCIGSESLRNGTFSNNISIGSRNLNGIGVTGTSKRGNVAIGNRSLADFGGNTASNSEDSNMAIGPFSMSQLTNGRNNIGIGYNSMDRLLQGSDNISIGVQEGSTGLFVIDNSLSLGNRALSRQLTGATRNTVIGNDAGKNIITGSNNVLMGCESETTSLFGETGATASNTVGIGDNVKVADSSVVIGAQAIADQPDSIVLGRGAVTTGSTGGQFVLASASHPLVILAGGNTPVTVTAYLPVIVNGITYNLALF